MYQVSIVVQVHQVSIVMQVHQVTTPDNDHHRQCMPMLDAYHHHTQSNDWNEVVVLKMKLQDLGWFKAPPKKSMLRSEPACAWFGVGMTHVNQQSKFLPALEKNVLRVAVKRFIGLHFYLPVAGHMPGEANNHVNMMPFFVTFVWAYYTEHQTPKVPAFTNVGRLLFTYIWRNQHPLFR